FSCVVPSTILQVATIERLKIKKNFIQFPNSPLSVHPCLISLGDPCYRYKILPFATLFDLLFKVSFGSTYIDSLIYVFVSLLRLLPDQYRSKCISFDFLIVF
ncbi:unnamed protein product, partial [Arabidopsis halleri]